MTNTLRAKIIMSIWSLQMNTYYEHLNGDSFHHYGNDYRIENPAPYRFLIYKKNPHSIHDDLIATATTDDNVRVIVREE